ncbi:MAG: AAA family ATPase, partial [Desulfobacterales bacterium]|nr:AAA family ATPase [Desulfobacterales bacterium]
MMNKRIIEKNPWWLTGKVPEGLLGTQRNEYLDKISQERESRKILAILGIRRCGKSTIIYQAIDRLLEEGVDPKYILYLSADDLEVPSREHLENGLDFYQ